MSSLNSSTPSLHRQASAAATTPKYDQRIDLLDLTKPKAVSSISKLDEGSGDESLDISSLAESSRLSRRWTQEALRKELARRKYRRWQKGKHAETLGATAIEDEVEASDGVIRRVEPVERASSKVSSVHGNGADLPAARSSRLRRGRERVKGIINTRNRVHKMNQENQAIDILYENQRGSFFFGVPLFSYRSLLNFDPSPWVNGHGKKSRVDITNAQPPDPTWEWDWKTWYVDMSHDVDEEGWEYSFSFQRGFAWHGTHPWFHSFVRRRRWLRKRVKKQRHHASALEKAVVKSPHGQTLTPEDFATPTPSLGTSLAFSNPAHLLTPIPPDDDFLEDTWDIQSFTRRLKVAAIDREKIIVVRTFLERGGDDLLYLAEKMPHIMSLFVFQTSRRQLLRTLMEKFEAESSNREERDNPKEPEKNQDKHRIDYLMAAVQAADEEVKKLEYWSDVRDMARKGQTLGAADEKHGWGREWQGLDSSGPANTREHIVERNGNAEILQGGAKATSTDQPGVTAQTTVDADEESYEGPQRVPATEDFSLPKPDKGKGKEEDVT